MQTLTGGEEKKGIYILVEMFVRLHGLSSVQQDGQKKDNRSTGGGAGS